jgi:hypothetical protein
MTLLRVVGAAAFWMWSAMLDGCVARGTGCDAGGRCDVGAVVVERTARKVN